MHRPLLLLPPNEVKRTIGHEQDAEAQKLKRISSGVSLVMVWE